MEPELMSLKILLPFKVFLEVGNVSRIVAETGDGHYGFLPQRLDCVAALVAGIFTYETATGGTKYIAVDEGVMVKTGTQVMVSVRNAIGGADLGKLHESVQKEFKQLDENEKNVRAVMAKMESSFMIRLKKFQQQ
jgi:F-type H+-transporting ATPase subunit epsilon